MRSVISLLVLCFVQSGFRPAVGQDQNRKEAIRLEAQGLNAESEQVWQAVLKGHPANPEALAHLGLLESRLSHYPEAIAFYKRALAAGPATPGLETNLGLAYFKNSQFAEALRPLSDELAKSPDDPRLTLLLGMTHYGMGDYLVAIPFLKRGAQQQPGNLPLRLTLAHSCLWSKQLECVMATYKEILSLDPASAEAEMIAGEALDESGDDSGALEHFRSAEAVSPLEPNVHFAVGYLLWTQNHFTEAAPEFAAEIHNDPHHGEAYVYLGDCHLELNMLSEAESELREALRLNPLSQLAHRDLGVVDAGTGKPVEAEAELRQAISLDPSDTTARYRLARVLQTLGKRTEAEEEFKTVSAMKQQHNNDLLKVMAPTTKPAPAAP